MTADTSCLWLLAPAALFPSGRGYSHTFLFSAFLLILGLILLARYRKSWLVVISLSSFAHLVLDQMWAYPTTLWWPLLGPLPPAEAVGWMPSILYSLFADPGLHIPELIGLAILLLLGYRLLATGKVTQFPKTGNAG